MPELRERDDGACREAVKAGKVRYVGFTGHKDPRIHLKMLAKPYDWDYVADADQRHGRPLSQLPKGSGAGVPGKEMLG